MFVISCSRFIFEQHADSNTDQHADSNTDQHADSDTDQHADSNWQPVQHASSQ